VLLNWPHPDSDWSTRLTQVEAVYCELATQISRFEALIIICRDAHHILHVRQQLAACGAATERINYHAIPTNDTWIRDYGPLSLVGHQQACLLDCTFNGWGGKFAAELDNRVSRQLHQHGAFPQWSLKTIDFILEGGSIDSDGKGTIMSTTACLLNPNRNPRYKPQEIEQLLQMQFGAKRILWLTQGHIIGDDTDGHIDMLARFCDERTIAYASCDNADDPHFASLQAMERQLRMLRTLTNQAYHLVPLPLPTPLFDPQGQRLAASYANFLIINQAVLVPLYEDPAADALALRCLSACFPGREIIGIPCHALILEHGSLHCATMQIPEIPRHEY